MYPCKQCDNLHLQHLQPVRHVPCWPAVCLGFVPTLLVASLLHAPALPLLDSPADCLCAGWEQQLRQYVLDHPEVVVVDSIDKIRQLHNRSTMLRPLQGEGIVLQQPQRSMQPQHTQQAVLVQAPLQVEIPEGMTEAEAQAALAAAGLAPPLLCKPLWTDGRDGSHQLAVLHDLEALGRLLRGAVCSEFKPPLVVQQFVEHGGVLFKVGG